MWKYKLVGLALFLNALFGKLDFEAQRLDFVQSKRYYTIDKIGEVPIPEISGLSILNDTIYCLTDSGGKPALYLLDQELNILDTLIIPDAQNIDWEGLTVNKKGEFFIGDFGNNRNIRKDLLIYSYKNGSTDSLKISYTQQENFPPQKDMMNFDAESIFWHNEKLHIFSKNRGKKCVKHYVVDPSENDHSLTPLEELWLNRMITGAASHEDIVVLLAYGKIYFFRLNDELIFSNPVMLIESTRFGQNEAIAFLDSNILLVCNEAGDFFKITFTLPKSG